MAIAVVGWGSLIWCPRELNLRSRWRADGPCLPVELARKSRDGRVTLVITPGRKRVRTYWAESQFEEIDEAIENLSSREGTTRRRIGSCPSQSDDVDGAIAAWLGDHDELEAAIWTNLIPTFPDDGLEELVVSYLNGLPEPWLTRAREYVEYVPLQVVTPVREAIEVALGWRRRSLPPSLFDGPESAAPCEETA